MDNKYDEMKKQNKNFSDIFDSGFSKYYEVTLLLI